MPSGTADRRSDKSEDLTPAGRVALVGAGAFGRFCLEAYGRAGDLTVVAVVDLDPAALAAVSIPGIRRERDWAGVVTDEAVEVVHLATPPFVRGAVAAAALEAGKSVFCEKPLALTLEEADSMIGLAAQRGCALGVDYVMRHHPAYRLLGTLAVSGLFGRLRTVSLDNYAQAVPAGHWFWDPACSGGVLVEHGVHFFDAYGQIAGGPLRVWGNAPRPEAIDVTVEYRSGALGRYYHEFAFPREVERTVGRAFFERGYVEIEGWIPTRLGAAVLAPGETLRRLVGTIHMGGTGHLAPEEGRTAGRVGRASARGAPADPGPPHVKLQMEGRVSEKGVTRLEVEFEDRQRAYERAIVAGMREMVRRHRDPRFPLAVPIEDARASLALAVAGQRAAASGAPVEVTDMDQIEVAPEMV